MNNFSLPKAIGGGETIVVSLKNCKVTCNGIAIPSGTSKTFVYNQKKFVLHIPWCNRFPKKYRKNLCKFLSIKK